MKLEMESSNTSLNSYTKLSDKSLKLTERLKLARHLWEFDARNVSNNNSSNMQQLILDWVVDLLVNNKRKKYSFDENDLISIWDQLFYYLTDVRFKNNPIGNGLLFVQSVIDSMSSSNVCLKQSVFSCCAKLFNTKFCHYFTSNFDQMTNILNYFLIEFNTKFEEENYEEDQISNKIDSVIEKCHIVLQKYFTCLKSQQHHTRLFNPLSKQILFNLLKFMANMKKTKHEKKVEVSELAWNILKYGLFSKSHSNVYLEFFKNLPNSFASSSNYQVAILFSTIQNESVKNASNLNAFCECAHLIAREFFSILTNIDYKQKITIIQFFIDLTWNLNAKENSSKSQKVENDQIICALGNLFQIVENLNLFTPIEDQNNNDMFKNWCKKLVHESLHKVEKFNEPFATYLISIIKIDHLFLDTEMDFILDKLHVENNLETFLSAYLEANVKFRQMAKVTHKLLDLVKLNKTLTFPDKFYDYYAELLETHQVDGQTIVNMWKEINKSLALSEEHSNFRRELLQFLNCIMSRINLCNNRMPSHLKVQSLQLLNENKLFLNTFLHGLNKIDADRSKINDDDDELIIYLKCYLTCGLVYILGYRYSLNTDTKLQTIVHQTDSLNDLNEYLKDLNEKFELGARKSKNFNVLFHLNRLQLLNVYALNTIQEFESPKNFLENLFCSDYNLNGLSKNKNLNFSKIKQVDDMLHYSVLHIKSIICENAYLILPLLNSRHDLRQQMYRNLIEISFAFRAQHERLETFEFDAVNLNALFNDFNLVKDLFIAFLETLIDYDLNDDEKSSSKFLKRCLSLVKSDFLDANGKKDLFDAKKFQKSELNTNQVKLFQMVVEFIPIEYLDRNFGLICFFLNEKIFSGTTRDKNLEKFSLSNYIRLSQAGVMLTIPIVKLESWIISLFDSLLNTSSLVDSNVIFDKVIRKSVNIMIKDNSDAYLSQFVDKLFEKIEKNNSNQKLISMIHLTFIQILEKICKMQEISDQKLKKDASSSQGSVNSTFNLLYKRLIDYFIELNSSFESEERKDSLENHNFYICSILMRRICSSQGFKTNENEAIEDQNEHVNYFNLLLNFCLKNHKLKVKELKKFSLETCPKKIKLSSFHMDFLKAFIFYSRQLNEKYDMKIDSVKYCEQFFNFYVNLDQNVFEFDLDYTNTFKLDSKDTDAERQLESKGQDEILAYMTRAICVSINILNTDQFKQALDSFELKTFEHLKSNNKSCLIKLAQLVKYLCSDFELDDKLKPEFSAFVQKFLVQIHPIYFSLLSSNAIDCLIEILNAQYLICSSKYILLPSHLVISSLQVYMTLPFENFSLENNVNLQELACKTINTILTRYSKKFQKIAAIICNLFAKLINITTNLANQNNIEAENVNLVVKAAQNLERVASQLITFKQDFSKITPYLISEYVLKANRIPIHPSIKIVLTNVMYNLISICDVHGVSQLHIVLPVGAKELFKNIYAEYIKYFKYKGKS